LVLHERSSAFAKNDRNFSEKLDMTLNRRNFLRTATLGCACCLAARFAGAAETAHGAAAKSSAAHAAPHWGYAGNSGPEHWADLQPDFKVCQLGLEQTPIDVANGMRGDASAAVLNYRSMPLRILNNGHTIQVNADAGSSCAVGGKNYELLQFHFHHPSEHLLAGKPFDLECHFVHKSSTGDLAVVGVFVKPGAENPTLRTIFDAMPAAAGPEVKAGSYVDPAALLPKTSGYVRYMGSLTTPPCSEGLTWTVFKEPIEASPDQIKKFAALFPNNARPVQKINRRFVIEAN
jgi:carbonic anhydrase